MKIAFYSPIKPIDHFIPSGDRLIARHLCQYLRGKGHDIFILSRFRTLFLHQRIVRYIFFWWPLHFIGSLINVLKERPDLFFSYHVTGETPDLLAPFLCRLVGVPYYIFTGDYSVTHRDNLKTRLGYYLARHALHGARHIFANTVENYTSLVEKLGRDKVTYIKPAVFLSDFKDYSPANIRDRYHIKENIPVISSAAMCRPGRKADSIRFLIDCLAQLKSEGINFRWIHTGARGEYPELKKLAEEKLGNIAIMPGTMPEEEVHALMMASDIFAFPGINETIGMVYLEAQFYKTPVVAFQNGGIAEVVKQNKTGILVPPMDQSAFVKALSMLINNPSIRTEMGNQAFLSISEDHDINKNYNKIIEIIHGNTRKDSSNNAREYVE